MSKHKRDLKDTKKRKLKRINKKDKKNYCSKIAPKNVDTGIKIERQVR